MPAGWNQTSGSFREGEDYSLFVSYENLFGKFAENYWNLVTKYHLKQMLPDGKSEYSKIEQIYALGYDIPNHYEQRYWNGELEKKDTFRNRVLSETPKFVQKKMSTSKNESEEISQELSTLKKEN